MASLHLTKRNVAFAISIWLLVFVLIQLKDLQIRDSYGFLKHFLRDEERAKLEKDLPHIQIVGYVTLEKRYGVFNRRHGVHLATGTTTVLCKSGQWYLVNGMPQDYFRTLLNEEEHPLLASPPVEMKPVTADSDREAMEEAARLLRLAYEDW